MARNIGIEGSVPSAGLLSLLPRYCHVGRQWPRLVCLLLAMTAPWPTRGFAGLARNKTDLIKEIVNPFFGYFVCDYFLGSEPTIEFATIAAPTALKWNTPEDAKRLKTGDMVYVQADFIDEFLVQYLPLVTARFLLMTGQWREPYLTLDPTVDKRYLALKNGKQITTYILGHPLVAHWFVQNPHIVDAKVSGIPYGVYHGTLVEYADALRKIDSVNKTAAMTLTYMSATHWSRAPLIAAAKKAGAMQATKADPHMFYAQLAASQFVFSPVGDRPDCYRHWEAIGLGAVPICNCPHAFQGLYNRNMLFVAHEDFNVMTVLSETWAQSAYRSPNRRLVLVAHWRQIFEVTRRSIVHNTTYEHSLNFRLT